MDSRRTPTIASNGAGISLQDLVRGERARALQAQLASWHPECSTEEIEDAIQTACKRFLEHAEGISAPGQVYSWIRTTAHRLLNRETAHHAQELSVEPAGDRLEGFADERAGPAEELMAEEDDADLARLVEEVNAALPSRATAVLALHTAGHKRPEIAERLGLSARTVKRDVEEIMEEARGVLARLAGGGCRRGESLVLRSVCGLATSVEEARAREHLTHCGRCEIFSERLIAWREKAGAMLPVPAVEGASPGLIERTLHKSAEGLSSLKQQVIDGAAQVKQQAAASYYRAVDPTPLAAARPGTIATVVASCVAIGGGAATYCVEQGVDPLGAARGLIATGPESESELAAPSPEPESTGPTYTPVDPTPESEAPVSEPTPAPAEEEPKPKPPPTEDSFEPVSPAYASSEGESEAAESYEASEPAPVESTARPAPVAASSPPEFGGP